MSTELALVVALAGVVCAVAPAEDLPLKQVVLFSSGVGYFHREGTVTGNAEVELSFRISQINDLLKSLVLQDYDGGQIAPVAYAPREPIERTLASFAVDISDNPSLSELLDRLRGIRVEVKSDTTRVGTILGMETQQKSVGDSILEFEVLNLLSDGAIVEVPIWQMKSVRILDPKVDADLKKALEVLAGSRDVEKRPVTLRFNGRGPRRVSAGYLLETPVWKTSYRLVIGDAALRLQGWAIVENTTDADWDEVGLTLVSGQPVSFIQNLYEPLFVSRPEVPVAVAAGALPQVYGKAMERFAEAEELAKAADREMARRALPGEPPAAAAAPAPRMALPDRAYGGFGGAAVTGALAAAVTAVGEKVGELFQYAIDQPVSIGRQRSAMIPIVNAEAGGEKVSVFNAQVDPKRPRNGVRLKNTTGLHLMAGPITVFDEGIYAGDALIEDVAPDDERLLTYAVDLDVEVEQQRQSHPRETLSAKINRGTLLVTRKQRRETKYIAKSVSAKGRTLLIEHPFAADWKLVTPPEPLERTQTVYRFRADLGPKAKAELNVVEEQPISETIVLTDASADQVALFIRMEQISPAVKAALEEVAKQKTALSDIRRQRTDRETRLKEIAQEQERIRKNMEQLDRGSDLYKRYVQKFTAQEDEYERLQGEIQELKAKEDELQKKLQDYIAGLTIE